ncbi:hypothetical protein KSP40_PGU011878 [Platanthera guangdongensis]|uniref:Uncharacterized protein n=1 Tax=Platanthera guangdongensis TaxID=2320717 RepID=A0ABR2N349_9ASPA
MAAIIGRCAFSALSCLSKRPFSQHLSPISYRSNSMDVGANLNGSRDELKPTTSKHRKNDNTDAGDIKSKEEWPDKSTGLTGKNSTLKKWQHTQDFMEEEAKFSQLAECRNEDVDVSLWLPKSTSVSGLATEILIACDTTV